METRIDDADQLSRIPPVGAPPRSVFVTSVRVKESALVSALRAAIGSE